MTEYERWLSQPLDDPDLTEELKSIQGQEDEINDRFYRSWNLAPRACGASSARAPTG